MTQIKYFFVLTKKKKIVLAHISIVYVKRNSKCEKIKHLFVLDMTYSNGGGETILKLDFRNKLMYEFVCEVSN